MQAGVPGDPELDKAERRHPYGPRALAALVPRLARPAFRHRSPASAQIMLDWSVIVGPAIAAVAAPLRLAAGQLTIGCAGPVALELQHLTEELRARINTHLGRPVIERLRFVQTRHPAVPALPPQSLQPTVEPELPGIPEGPLREALAALGRAVSQQAGLTARGARRRG